MAVEDGDLSIDSQYLRTLAEALSPAAVQNANISFSSASAQTIKAAPGVGKRLRITKLALSCASNFTMQVLSGSTVMMTLFGNAVDLNFLPALALGENEALVLDSDIATLTVGGVSYYEEDV